MNSSECLSPRELARMVDGTAGERARKRWLSHLNDCIDCRTVLGDAASYVAEKSADDSRASSRLADIVPLWAWAATAAILAVGVGVALISVSVRLVDPRAWFDSGGAQVPEISSSTAAGLLFPTEKTSYTENRWQPSERGLGFTSGLLGSERAFRAGVYLVDLRVAIGEGRFGEGSDVVEALTPLVGESDALVAVRQDVKTASCKPLDLALAQLESDTRASSDSVFLTLGIWSESARLAATANDSSFFENEKFKNGLDAFVKLDLPKPVSGRLAAIESLLAGGLTEGELPRLRRELRGLMLLN